MPREVRITKGLESMGPLRPDVPGSVFKGKRTGDMVTAIKILPVTIKPQSDEFVRFYKEAENLRRINQEPNANLVKVLNFGLTEIGSHPFLETEFIEGPDLSELSEPPRDKIFPILEVIKVADHVANALAQCHRFNVIHGNLKSTNVKFDLQTDDYVLVGFGESLLADQKPARERQKNNAYRAPEQMQGKLLLQSDIYSYGLVLYELLAGSVPFLLFNDPEEEEAESRGAGWALLAEARRENLPESWTAEQKEREMQIPEWLLQLLNRCLAADPEKRFSTAMELQHTLLGHSISATENKDAAAGAAILLQNEVERLRSLVIHTQETSAVKEVEVARLKAMLSHREEQLTGLKYQMGTLLPETSAVSISKPMLLSLVVIGLCLSSLAVYFFVSEREAGRNTLTAYVDSGETFAEEEKIEPDADALLPPEDTVADESSVSSNSNEVAAATVEDKSDEVFEKETPVIENKPEPVPVKKVPKRDPEPSLSERPEKVAEAEKEPEPVYQPAPYRAKYTLQAPQVFFYKRPEESSRINLVMVPSDNSELVAVEDSNGFIYVSFFDSEGKMVKGWLRKQDLRRLN